MDQLPRHVKRALYCEELGPTQLDIWIDTIGLTSINITLLILGNVPQIHPSEVNDILKE